MTVIDAFSQWYQQLQPNDQQVLCNFLRNWLLPSTPQQTTPAIRFGGRNTGPVTSQMIGPAKVRCPRCGNEIETSKVGQ